MNLLYILLVFMFDISNVSSNVSEYDDISEINNKVWSKNKLTWTFINYPKNLNRNYVNSIYYDFLGAFNAWEAISHFKFEYLSNNTRADIVINFVSNNHQLFENDKQFKPDTLAHAFFPENGDIHMNDNVNWSLSFYSEPHTYNMFYVILHEIGHSLGLNHINNFNSIMYPAYISRSYNAYNFKFEPDSLDEKSIKEIYSEHYTSTTNVYTETTQKVFTTNNDSTTSTSPKPETEEFYPDFSVCKRNDGVDWCNHNLIFNLIYDIEGYLFLYRSQDFWMYTDQTGIKSRKFNHYDYWNGANLTGLISIIQEEKKFALFYETFVQLHNCESGESNLNYSKINITNKVHGVFYNHTSDTLYLFSRETPKTYYKLINSRSIKAKMSIKPISLWKIDIFDYDVVFSRNNIVYFVKRNMIDYFDFALDISVKGIEFKDLFLRDQCKILPLVNDLINEDFNSTLV